MDQVIRILHLEDNAADIELVQSTLESAGMPCQISQVESCDEFTEALRKGGFDIILVDFRLPTYDGMSALRLVQELGLDIPFIFVSGTMGEEAAIEGLTQGATDYVLKQNLSRLAPAVKRALHEAENQRERKRAEDMLRTNEERYRRAEAIGHVGTWEYDLQTTQFWGSDEAKRIFGFNLEQANFSTDEFENCIPERKRVHQALVDLIEAGKPYNLEFEIHPLDSPEPRIITSVATVQGDEHGDPQKVVGFIQDVTDQRRAQEKLQESETRFRMILEGIPDLVLIHDDEGAILYINAIGAAQLEWSAKDLIGKNLRKIVLPEQAVLIADHIRETHKTGWCRFETTYIARSGWKIIAEVSDRPIKFGKDKAILRVSRDITERKQAEESVRRAKEYWERTFDAVPDLLAILDTNFHIIQVNKAMADRLHLTPDECIGQICYEAVHGTKGPPSICPHAQSLTDGLENMAEVREKRLGGDFIVTTTPLRESDGRMIGSVHVARDITERKRAEEALQQSYHQLRETFYSVVNTLTSTVEKRDPYTAGHQRRTTILACAIAEEMELPVERIEGIRMAGSIHDIGKIEVPTEILSRPGSLTDVQYEMIKIHPRTGHDILKGIDFPWPVAEIVLQHHERMDGSGYPQGIKGKKIMLEARILAVADVIEAMSSYRPYRPSLGIDKALEEISQNKGVLFDPDVVDACIRLFAEKEFKFE